MLLVHCKPTEVCLIQPVSVALDLIYVTKRIIILEGTFLKLLETKGRCTLNVHQLTIDEAIDVAFDPLNRDLFLLMGHLMS